MSDSIENLGDESNQEFETASIIVERMNEIMPVECMWAFISEFQESINSLQEEQLTFDQAANQLWWRAACEWDL